VSTQATEPPARSSPSGGGPGLKKKYGGIPVWGWGAAIVLTIGVVVYMRVRSASKTAAGSSGTTSTSDDVSTSGTGDTENSLSEYEQLNSELTSIQGNEAALLAAIQDLQGNGSSAPSSGAQVTVPGVVGERAETAGAKIRAAGLVPHLTPGTPKGSIGHIESQDPKKGAKVAKGSTVQLTNRITQSKKSNDDADAADAANADAGGSSSSGAGSSGAGSSGTSSAPAGRPSTTPKVKASPVKAAPKPKAKAKPRARARPPARKK
jgi:PASTA domain